MYKYAIFLLLIPAVFSNLTISVDDLKQYVAIIDSQVQSRQATLSEDILLAKYNLRYESTIAIENLTGQLEEESAAYWVEIAALEAAAQSDGRTISQCVEPGNQKFYELGNNTFNSLVDEVNNILNEGYGIVTNSSDSVTELNEKLENLENNANACSDDSCAKALYLQAEIFYVVINATFDDISLQLDYVDTVLIDSLDLIELDAESYVKSFQNILISIINCIN